MTHFLHFLLIFSRIRCKQKSFNIPYEMEENKKLEAIMDVFKKLTFDEKKTKVVSLVEWLWESEVYSRTLTIIKELEPTEEYLENIYRWIMEINLQIYEKWKEKDKLDAQQKIESYMHKLNELSEKQKEKDEEEADAMLNMFI